MKSKIYKGKKVLKEALKANIKKAWYQLDKQSYQNWLEGRTISKSELNY